MKGTPLLVWKKRAFKKLGDICACCNEHRKEFLSVDHINGGGRAHRKNFSQLTFYQWICREEKVLEVVQLLCMNCNWGKRHSMKCVHNEDVPREETREMIEALEEQVKDLEKERGKLLFELAKVRSIDPLLPAPEGMMYVRHIGLLDAKEFESVN